MKNMDMFDYYKKAFENFGEYQGRATAREYWYFVLCHFLVSFSLLVVIIIGATDGKELIPILGGISLGLYTMAAFVPSLMLAIRRLHDTGKSGWFLLIGFIPAIGGILLTVLLAQKSDDDNKWGNKLGLEDLSIENERLALPLIEYDDDYV